ncbi:MAG: beta-ketoacyl-ACP synthase 3 [Bacteroidales bacterium]|jgi:3-oxoacyl-[acyl-carrier-protein] synthase-3|nr:beta-ketoacyl-ACP synthase 3 [Bacteroidales bacterium]
MKIIGTGSELPSLAVTNEMLSEILDTNNEWISTRTGISQRRIISEESLTELAVSASKKALKNANLEAKDIDFIICSNTVNNYVLPGLSCIVQGELGAHCPCIDLNSACSGFIYALYMAAAYLDMGKVKNILIVCAEEPSKMVDWHARDTSVIFGDGAGATVVTQGKNLKSIHLTTTCAIEPLYYQRELEYNPYTHKQEFKPLVMNGKDVYKMAVNASVQDINTVMKEAHVTQKEISFYLLHQANVRIIETIRDFLGENEDKFPKNIHKYGNTSSASIPILLDEMNMNGQLKDGDILVMSAFGAGFSTGACVMEWSNRMTAAEPPQNNKM